METNRTVNETGGPAGGPAGGPSGPGRSAVVFGGGPVGVAAAERFAERGLQVRVVTRRGRLPERLSGKACAESADATDRRAVLQVSAGADYIVHCANVPYQDWYTVLPVVQRNLIDAALAGNAVFAASENLYMYARPTGAIVEDSPVDPPSRKGKLRQELHELLHSARSDWGLAWVTVRASDYYGPGATMQSHFGTRFLDPLFEGKRPRLFGDPDQLHSFVYVDDYGRAIADAALDATAHNRAWIAPHDRAIMRRDFAQLFFRAVGRSGDVGQIPNVAVRLGGIVSPLIRELAEMRYQFDHPFTVDDTAFRNHFRTAPVPLEEGVRRTVEWYRAARARDR